VRSLSAKKAARHTGRALSTVYYHRYALGLRVRR
jgi:hypothetical protein